MVRIHPSNPRPLLAALVEQARADTTTIRIESPWAIRTIELDRGRIRSIQDTEDPDLRLGRLLVRHGLVSSSAVDVAAETARRRGVPLGHLLAGRLVAPSRLYLTLAEQSLARFKRFLKRAAGTLHVEHGSSHVRSPGCWPIRIMEALEAWVHEPGPWDPLVHAETIPPATLTDSAHPLWVRWRPDLEPFLIRFGSETKLRLDGSAWPQRRRVWLLLGVGALTGPRPRPRRIETRPPPQASSVVELRRWWHKEALRHHPDRGGDPETFMRLLEQYRAARGKLR